MCKYCERARAQVEDELDHAERVEAERCPTLQRSRVPCVLLTGFLGSGKTTLVNGLLGMGKKVAVVENEVGKLAVDDALLAPGAAGRPASEVVLMPNGCMCCRVRGDLIDALKRTLAAGDRLDGVVIELSGLSQLAPVVQTFFADSFVQRRLRLDAVICVVDSLLLATRLSPPDGTGGASASASASDVHVDVGDGVDVDVDDDRLALMAGLVREQVALADIVLLNKQDALQGDQAAVAAAAVAPWNATASRVPCSLARDGVPDVVRRNLFDMQRFAVPDQDGWDSSGGHHAHDALGFSTLGVRAGALHVERLAAWLEEAVLRSFPEAVVRCKGVLWQRNGAMDERWLLHGVFGRLTLSRDRLFRVGEDRKSMLVFIGALDDERYGHLRRRLERGVQACEQREEAFGRREYQLARSGNDGDEHGEHGEEEVLAGGDPSAWTGLRALRDHI